MIEIGREKTRVGAASFALNERDAECANASLITIDKLDYLFYPAIFDNRDNDGYYTVTFPDVPDTIAQG